ncbi:MAG: histone deacetylase [Desulfatitalea sp.]|nr:histone deacetylase [Desulfatitalea sp.]NNK02873.1 histone deacetylase [Desulfatitalea sp.]
MKRTGFLYDQRFLLHDTGAHHPERAERLQAIVRGLTEAGLMSELVMITARHADMRWLQTVHSEGYIRRFEEVCLAGHRMLDCQDNQMCPDTWDAAQLAAGGTIEAARMIMAGEIDNAFCAVRPPGHHAERERAMGFCYFNNVAVAAKYLQAEWGVERIGIIDFDVHHGNGTQHMFESDPTVFYYSIHQHPSFCFPGTGREFEQGLGDGNGFTKNSPVLPGQGDETYRQLIEKDMLPLLSAFEPQFLIVSAGFDAHRDDEMADMRLTNRGFEWIIRCIVQLAETHASGKLLSVLEGGYSLERLPELAADHVRILLEG